MSFGEEARGAADAAATAAAAAAAAATAPAGEKRGEATVAQIRKDARDMTAQEQKIAASPPTTGCRICYEDGTAEELIEPCECAGTLGLIHASCLEKWLSTWNTDRCEICKYVFVVERRAKPLPQSLSQWWRTRGLQGPQSVTGDAVCLLVMTPLCLAATYLCAVGATAYARLGFWEGTGLAVLCFMLVASYFLWLFITVRFHCKSWKQWRRRNQDVKLLIKSKMSPEARRKLAKANKSPRGGQPGEAAAAGCVGNEGSTLGGFFVSINFSFGRTTEPIYNFHQQTSFV